MIVRRKLKKYNSKAKRREEYLDIDELVIGSHDLKEEFGSRIGQYMHLILTD